MTKAEMDKAEQTAQSLAGMIVPVVRGYCVEHRASHSMNAMAVFDMDDGMVHVEAVGIGDGHKDVVGFRLDRESALELAEAIEVLAIHHAKPEVLVDKICLRNFKSMAHAVDMTHEGVAEFCGNQWNEDWRWKRDALLQLPRTRLLEIYGDVTKDDNASPG